MSACALACTTLPAGATGALPDTTIVLLSESEGQAQMGVSNTDQSPLLLYTTIENLPEDDGLTVYAVPPIARLEPGGRQVVRFVLAKPSEPLRVQHLKRVSFEGIPSKARQGAGEISFAVRQSLPLVISPKGLPQDNEPWKRLEFAVTGDQVQVRNPSPYVIRLSPEVELLPAGVRARLT